MSNTKLFIPDTIHVGFRKRQDTYTGKLAYVIYTDTKGVKRKETSWENWRDKKITAIDCANTPTEGFVLNKGVGGARESYGWNARNEYIRVYDSERDFEFEISVANLLYILQETSSIRGKGLEGKFVYAWDGKDLVLLPENAQEYQACLEFTANQAKKVSARDLVAGRMYKNKKGEHLIYLGKLPTAKPDCKWREPFGITEENQLIQYVFVPTAKPKTDSPILLKALTSLAHEVSTDTAPDFLDALAYFQANRYGSKVAEYTHTTKDITFGGNRGYHNEWVINTKTQAIGLMYVSYSRVHITWSSCTLSDLPISMSKFSQNKQGYKEELHTNRIPPHYKKLCRHAVLESGVTIPID